MQKPNVKSSQMLHDGYVCLREDLLEKEGGDTQAINTILCRDATTMLALDFDGRWILNREYRHAMGDVLLGCPGGRLEAGENPAQGARREFFEETGYEAGEVVLLGVCYPFPGLCNQRIFHYFCPKAVKKGAQKLDLFEFIETELIEDAELRRRILSGARVDGILLTALWYKDHFC
jgi:8-oxo-dGTP pyrophosphatase MutT (NUDIX family)